MNKTSTHVPLFFVITFAWTWVFYFSIIIFGLNPYEGTGLIFLICGGCSPTFTGFIMALITYSKEEKIEYIKRCYQVKRIGARWWLVIILLFPAIYAVGIFFDVFTGGSLPEMTILRSVIQNPVSFIPLLLQGFIFSGPFPEELGWRGFALKPLLERFGFTKASVLLGVLWAVWHLPLFFMPAMWHGQAGFAPAGFWTFILQAVGLTMIMSFVFIKARHSTLSAMMLHLTSNLTAQMLAKISDTVVIASFLIIFIVGIALCVYMGNAKREL
jgi:membrane protease YdiL (CAAX protease family)